MVEQNSYLSTGAVNAKHAEVTWFVFGVRDN